MNEDDLTGIIRFAKHWNKSGAFYILSKGREKKGGRKVIIENEPTRRDEEQFKKAGTIAGGLYNYSKAKLCNFLEAHFEGAKLEANKRIIEDIIDSYCGKIAEEMKNEFQDYSKYKTAYHEIDRLAEYIMTELPDEITVGGAVDTAIKIMESRK